ncbi:hypothetical protein F2Q68_00009567 [Brassica cretica]|uniref:Uncharacterized protein n=1 Tax=Brassica cretica TaxID=69181 RepID=A0A8S9KRK2_BRACR|nr:hypothetical protein F2Q68_00009567 [Brassica cretica]
MLCHHQTREAPITCKDNQSAPPQKIKVASTTPGREQISNVDTESINNSLKPPPHLLIFYPKHIVSSAVDVAVWRLPYSRRYPR